MTRPIRSILFSPGNQPKILSKVPRIGADVSIACWEDGTPVEAKGDEVRGLSRDAVQALRDEGWTGRMFIRTNHPTSEWFEDDVAAIVEGPYDGVVLPKLENADNVQALARALEAADPDRAASLDVILGIESGHGVINIKEIIETSRNAVGVYFGAEDYATSIGGKRSPSNAEVAYPRARVAMFARTYGLSCFDCGTLDFSDDERFLRECEEARGFGYTGKICFHPKQAALANQAFMPTDEEVAYYKRMLEEYEAALAEGRATPAIDGQMIDGPLIKRAEATLALAGAA